MRRILIASLVPLVGVLVAPTAPAFAADPPPRYRLTTTFSVVLVDERVAPLPDTRCAFAGATTQETSSTNVTHRLGTGRPGTDYPPNHGPFRDASNNAILFVCGEVSVCFPSASVVVRPDGTASASLPVSFHVGPGVPCANDTRKDLIRILPTTAPGGGRVCVGAPTLAGPALDRIEFGPFCLTSVELAPQLTITRFTCYSVDAEYTCEVDYGGETGLTAISWFLNGMTTPTAALANLTEFTRRCAPGLQVRVRVGLADDASEVGRSTSFRCLGDEEY